MANSDPKRAAWVAFAYKGHGTLLRPRTFADHTKEVASREGLPDGLKVDRGGNVWATGPGGVCVFTPQGELLGRISAGAKVANSAWGDDGSTLYITATTRLSRIRVATRGDRWPT